jgi:hypothetical protein
MYQLHFPIRYNINTTVDEDEIPIYRWQDDGKQIKGGGAMLDSRFVPCNRI